jgi:hypothetical protein
MGASARNQLRLLCLVGSLVIPCAASGQEAPDLAAPSWTNPIVPPQCLIRDPSEAMGSTNGACKSVGRFPLFRIPAAFLVDPIGLEDDDVLPAGTPPPVAAESILNPGSSARFNMVMGNDNPFFDFKTAGDPGGVGYYRVYTQYLLVDSQTTNLCLGMRAAMPAGLENDGVARGPTVISPHVACYQELDGGLAFQGFVAKHLPARAGWTDTLERGLHYGLALQGPALNLPSPGTPDVHWFVEAVGGSWMGIGNLRQAPSTWGVIPGMHWRMGDNWWMSSGVVLPVGTVRNETGLLQIICSWRY